MSKSGTKPKVVRQHRPRLSDEKWQEAIDAVQCGESFRKVAARYQIGISTLHDAVNLGRKNHLGPELYLGKEF